MVRVLIIKLSSMGDIIHALPSLSDAAKHNPTIEFHWVVEKSFKDIPLWHPNVTRVIPIELRRWRKERWRCLFNGEFRAFLRDLRKERYDLVIDAQSSIKSAIVTRLSRGLRCGYSFKTTRERFASLFYQKRFSVIFEQHAIRRMRLLFSKVLGYTFNDSIPDYGVNRNTLPAMAAPCQTPFLVFLHGTSWATKLWPENYWRALIKRANSAGFTVLLPWGNADEKARAERLASAQALVLPKLKINEVSAIITQAKAVVSVDTGLGHAAAAFGVPAVSLYGPTDPRFTAALGNKQLHLAADFSCAPCQQKVCSYTGPSEEKPACFTTLPPDAVWRQLESLL